MPRIEGRTVKVGTDGVRRIGFKLLGGEDVDFPENELTLGQEIPYGETLYRVERDGYTWFVRPIG